MFWNLLRVVKLHFTRALGGALCFPKGVWQGPYAKSRLLNPLYQTPIGQTPIAQILCCCPNCSYKKREMRMFHVYDVLYAQPPVLLYTLI